MACAIRQLLEAPEGDRGKMAHAGHARLHECYGQAAIVDAYLTLYRALLAGKSGAG
jgi:glycosyltransferase involved in cell wall biosynthesis